MSIGYFGFAGIAETTRDGSVCSAHFRSEVSQSCDNSKPASSHAPCAATAGAGIVSSNASSSAAYVVRRREP